MALHILKVWRTCPTELMIFYVEWSTCIVGPNGRLLWLVGHSAWLLAMTNAVLEFEEGSEDVEEFGTMFGQAELRSATLTFTENN